VLRDHLFLQAPNAWKGPGPESCQTLLGSRPSPYSPQIVEQLQSLEREENRDLLSGIYAALTGPCYETPHEILALRSIGVDAVGMSTAVEAETAARLGMSVAAISCITNKAAGLAGKPLDHHEVLATAKQVVSRVSQLFERWLKRVSRETMNPELKTEN
jgi:purine-nucleoside phosphorylase